MLQNNYAHMQLLSLCSRAHELQLLKPACSRAQEPQLMSTCATVTKPCTPEPASHKSRAYVMQLLKPVLQQQKTREATAVRSQHTTTKSPPACCNQRKSAHSKPRPSAAKKKVFMKKYIFWGKELMTWVLSYTASGSANSLIHSTNMCEAGSQVPGI